MSKPRLAAWLIRGLVIAGSLTLTACGDVTGVTRVGRLQAKHLDESSGLAASRRHPGVLYTHNDSGGDPVIFAVRPDGTPIRQFRVPARNNDWEDIAIDDAGHLYIADTGNNDADRRVVEVHRLPEPADVDGAAPASGDGRSAKKHDARRAVEGRLPIEHTWRLRYPAKPFDCESLVIAGGYGYLVSKAPRDGQRAVMYRFPLDEGAAELTLEKVTDLPIARRVTGASISADGRRLAIVTDGELCLFDIDGDPAAAGHLEPRRVRLPDKQIEGVAFTAGGILMTAESREVYEYRPVGDDAAAAAARTRKDSH